MVALFQSHLKDTSVLLFIHFFYSLPSGAAAIWCCRAAWSKGTFTSCCWWAADGPTGGPWLKVRDGRTPRLLRITLFPKRAAALAAMTASLGCAFLHSTYVLNVFLDATWLGVTFLFLMVWKCISHTFSTVSSRVNVTKPNPRCRFVCWSMSITASSTLPKFLIQLGSI